MDKSSISKKKLKEEVVPHKLKIKKMFNKANTSAAAGDHDDDPGSHNSCQSNNKLQDDSNGSNEEEKKHRKLLDAEISKGDIKMRAALNSYLSVSESEGEETKHPRQSMKK